MEAVIGLGAAFLAIFSALMVVMHRNPMVSVVFLIGNLGCVALLFLLLGGPFLAAIQVIVYAGAIMVLFLFVIMLLNLRQEDPAGGGRLQRWLHPPAALALAAGLLYALLHHRLPLPRLLPASPGFGSVERFGRALFTDHLFAFELVSLLLVVAMVGAVVLAKRRIE